MGVKFEGVEREKSLGKISSNTFGISTNVRAEVVQAEYAKDNEGKLIKSGAGNKKVSLNCKVINEITKNDGSKATIPTYFNVDYYETDFSPKLKEVKPTENLSKFIEVKYNNGGCGKEKTDTPFGWFKVRNYQKDDGRYKNTININGGNIQVAIKKEGVYTVKDFDGNPMVYETDNSIRTTIKGFIKPINDTEDFIKHNYNSGLKRLDFDVYYMENDGDSKYDTTMPCSLENIEKDKVMKFIEFVKNTEDTIVGFKGEIKKYSINKESTEESTQTNTGFGNYKFGSFDVAGYEARLVIDYDESKNNWVVVKTSNTGKLILDGSTMVDSTEDDLEFPF